MTVTDTDEARITQLLRHDVEATLGPGHDDIVAENAERARLFVDEAERYTEMVVQEVQQYFHDCFVDTTWPECPFHHRHPLWLHDGHWTCEQEALHIAKLGELRASPRADGRYTVSPGRHRPLGG